MRLGVDFGTTRIVVSAVDRGNYPIVAFDAAEGEAYEWFPSLAAVRGEEVLYGWRAWSAQEDPEATIIRSLKRYLPEAGPQTLIQIGESRVPMLDLLSGLCGELRRALLETSSLGAAGDEPLQVMLGVPANANGNQRFLTVEAFRRAGFEVAGLLNEPSAASIEYGHGARGKREARGRDLILVYDLGGGTFDASLVEVDDNRHEVLASEGIPVLGGDDFDELLASLALGAAGVAESDLSQAEWFLLLEECRRKKEALHPNTKRITIELEQLRDGWATVAVPVAEFYDRCQPLVDETIHAARDLLSGHQGAVEAVYVAGGASELPLVSRALREEFGRRVRRSPYTRSATAIGLAIQADTQAGYLLRERFTRNFGVWREADSGQNVVFDPLFVKGTPLPVAGAPPDTVSRRYHAVHNVGHFRYLECSHTTPDGRPAGEVMLWDEILFPFDRALQARDDLAGVEVVRRDGDERPEIEEAYSVDSGGAVTVTISNRTANYRRSYRLGRWAVPAEPLVPGKKRRKRRAATA
jgi:molecular chaperone DnaK (HSP70)